MNVYIIYPTKAELAREQASFLARRYGRLLLATAHDADPTIFRILGRNALREAVRAMV